MRMPPVLGALLVAACSSVPDVVYDDQDAGRNSGSSTSGSSGAAFSCPNNPPPSTVGVCCGSRLCVKCSAAQCDRCADARCSSDDVCCRRGSSSSVSCQRSCD